MPWFIPILLMGAITFTIGVLCFAIAIVRSGMLTRQVQRLVVGGLVVMAVARFVPWCCANSDRSGRDRRALAIGV